MARMATHCCILLLLATVATAHTISDHGTLATLDGRVLHGATGEPVRKARVTFKSTVEGHDSELVATTDDAGHFRFANITPGVYRLTAQKHGFIEGGYGETKPEDDVTLLKITAGDQLQDLTLRLFPGGTISGRILDADGDPAPGQQIVIWRRTVRRGETSTFHADDTTTNQAGDYRVEGLSKGTYMSAPTQTRRAMTFARSWSTVRAT